MLKNNLATKFQKQENINKPSALSRNTGISEQTISHILKGDTKNPGVYTVAKIADALGCSIEELIGKTSPKTTPSQPSILQKTKEWNPELFKNCLDVIVKLINKEQKEVTFEKAISAIVEVYNYSIGKNSQTVDLEFASWFVDNSL